MPLLTWNDYPELINGIASGSWKTIGWGAGLGFINFHESTLLKHHYLVDRDPSKWGSYVGGFEVKSPSSIACEDPARTIIIIYNFYDHGESILADIDNIGPYKSIMNFNPSELFKFTKRLHDGINSLSHKKQANSEFGIVIQGPFYESNTLLALKYYANKYPNDWLILSTWEETPLSQLNSAREFCDYIVTNPSPRPGYGNRNNQITSTYAGLRKAKEIGVKFALKTRTNTLATGLDILKRSEKVLSDYDSNKCNQYGLHNRIITTERYTHRYIPYLISDIIMYGHIDDLISFFSAPHDDRNLQYNDIKNTSIYDIIRAGYLTEVYLAKHFLERIGWTIKNDIDDYWNVLKYFFIVLDERWFGHFFPRYEISNLDGIKNEYNLNTYIDFNAWSSIYHDQNKSPESKYIDLKSITYDDFEKNRNYEIKN